MDIVLFTSMHDGSRGPMAAALFNAMAHPERALGRSAGYLPSRTMNPLVRRTMSEAKIPLGKRVPHMVTRDQIDQASLVIHIGNGVPMDASWGEIIWDVPLIRPATEEMVHLVRRDLEKRIGRIIAE
jgi:protein-tyrosine-phosphatase